MKRSEVSSSFLITGGSGGMKPCTLRKSILYFAELSAANVDTELALEDSGREPVQLVILHDTTNVLHGLFPSPT